MGSRKAAEPRFYFVAIDARPEDADRLSAQLFQLGATGLEERDASTLSKGKEGKVTVVASFATEEEARAALAKVPKGLGARLEELVGDAWRDAWKEHFKPFALCDGLWVRPPWEAFEAKAGDRVLELEPGRAFGTGLHETTSLVAQALSTHRAELDGQRILDVGCGSGILALVALAFGAKDALGTDVDKDAISVAKENAERNGLASRTQFITTPISRVKGTFPVVVANIEADVLIGMQKELERHVTPGGLLVLSGILATRKADVLAAFTSELLDAPAKGEWVALVYRVRA
jgi:ribosomal protein L11 methyltransferase